MTHRRLKRLTERRARPERHEQIEPEHGRWEHERNRDERFDEQLAAKLGDGKKTTEPDPQGQQDA